jgi:hypothetical protein
VTVSHHHSHRVSPREGRVPFSTTRFQFYSWAAQAPLAAGWGQGKGWLSERDRSRGGGGRGGAACQQVHFCCAILTPPTCSLAYLIRTSTMPAVLDGTQVERIRQEHQAVSLSFAPTNLFVFFSSISSSHTLQQCQARAGTSGQFSPIPHLPPPPPARRQHLPPRQASSERSK